MPKLNLKDPIKDTVSLSDRLEEEIKVFTGRKRRSSARFSSFGQKINQNYIRSSRALS